MALVNDDGDVDDDGDDVVAMKSTFLFLTVTAFDAKRASPTL